MPLTASFSISQTLGSPSIIDLADTSTGDDAAVVARRVYLTKSSGTTLVPSGTTTTYIDWDYDDATIALDVLDKDYGVSVRVDWINVGGTVLYTSTVLTTFTMYNSDFEYSLISQEANGDASINNTNWLYGRMKLRLALDDADNAITAASSITNSQAANDRGTFLRENINLFY